MAVLGYTGLYLAILGCTGLYQTGQGCTGLVFDWLGVITGSGGSGGPADPGDPGGPGGPGDPGGQDVSLDDMHSENIWFSWSKPSNY